MRALLNGERFLSFVAFPTKSFGPTPSNYAKVQQTWNQSRLYSKSKSPSHPDNDLVNGIKKCQNINHLKNGTLFRTELPQNPIGSQTVAFSKQSGSPPPTPPPASGKPPGKKVEPPAFCDPPKTGAPCSLQPKESKVDKLIPKQDGNSKATAGKSNTITREATKKDQHSSGKKELPNSKSQQSLKSTGKSKDAPSKSALAKAKNPSQTSVPPGAGAVPSKKAKKKPIDTKPIPIKPGFPLGKFPCLDADSGKSKDNSNKGDSMCNQNDKKDGDSKEKSRKKDKSFDKDKKCAEFKAKLKKANKKYCDALKNASSKNKKDVDSECTDPSKKSKKSDKRSRHEVNKLEHIIDEHCQNLKKLTKEFIVDFTKDKEGQRPKKNRKGPFAECLRKLEKSIGDVISKSENDSLPSKQTGDGKPKEAAESKPGPCSNKAKTDPKQDQDKDDSKRKQSKEKKTKKTKCDDEKGSEKTKSPKKKKTDEPFDDCLRKLEKSMREVGSEMIKQTAIDKPVPKIPSSERKVDQAKERKRDKLPSKETTVGAPKSNDSKKSTKESDPKMDLEKSATAIASSKPIEKEAKTPESKPATSKTKDSDSKSKSKSKSKQDKAKKKNKTEDKTEEKSKQKLLTFPVVPLHETLDRYLCSVQPLVDKETFDLEQQIVRKFEKNKGAELQKLLENAAESETNWLTQRWTDSAYLKIRSPVTVHTSPCMAFPIQKFLQPIDYLGYVAKCIYGMLEFKQLVDNNEVPVVKMCDFELDNSQFGKIFGGVRIPMPITDAIEQYNDSDYIVVINKNNFYKLPVYKSGGEIVHVHAMRDQLDDIINGSSEPGDPIGLLTHDSRDNWAEVHSFLMRGEENCHVLSIIEESLFTVSIDEHVDLPSKDEERSLQAAHLLHGGGRKLNSANRWMDKTLQLIVNPNGFSGICFEHSPADCQPLAMLLDFVQQKIHQPGYGCESCEDEKIEPFTPLKFQPMKDCIELWIAVAQRNIDMLCRHLQLHVFKFDCHGKKFIMAQGLNTDSYIQVAIQLAFFILHKELPAQYEAAHLRIFAEGRTETIRSTTNESLAFVKSMTSAKATKKDRMEGLRGAVDAHQELTKLALQGRGIDRHLFGLQQMAKENDLPLPKFFKSAGYSKSIDYRIFSSQVATTHDAFLSYGPLTPSGYGCCYNPREIDIIFSISAWKTNNITCAKSFGKAINDALNQIRELVLDTGGDLASMDICKCDAKRKK